MKCKNCKHEIIESPNKKVWGTKYIHVESIGMTPAMYCSCHCKKPELK